MKALVMFCLVILFVMGLELRFAAAQGGGKFVVRRVKNPVFRDNQLFRAYEDYRSPRVRRLREDYALEKVVAGETDEFKRILLLRHWMNTNIAIDNEHPTKTRGDTFAILDAARKGGKFHCTHFSIVQHAILNSFGYVARRLGCGPGLKKKGHSGHHGVNEVWVNKFSKWMIIDAKYDIHFEKDGVPLSALDIRDEIWRDGGKSVVTVHGPDRKPIVPKDTPGDSWGKPDTYRWCSWEMSTNRFTAFPATLTSTIVMYEDDIFRKNVWYRGGKPMWAYNTPYLITTTNRGWIEWTPNVIASTTKIKDDRAEIFLKSFTPNFKTFQMKTGDGKWTDCDERVTPKLQKRLNRFSFRTVNLFGVTGPDHHVEIAWKTE